ncbi:glycoside hydrolase family 6 protein [Xylariaceae sp. AK1471]|nr:glycoside hydrolase family 6 protein [Xylariaceae sp. AK1471]
MLTSLLTSLTLVLTLGSVSAEATKCSVPAILDAQVNVWKTHNLHPTSLYRLKVEQAVAAIKDEKLRGQASKVANFGTFMWINSPEDIQTIPSVADEVPCDEILGLVLNNLPYKDGGSPSEYDPNTAVAYQSLYIEPLAKTIKAHLNTAFAVIIEPGAFPQYFNATSSASSNQNPLVQSYRSNIPVALNKLDLPNVITYLDAGNSNSLDWDRLRNGTADAIIDIYEKAGRPVQMRGFATNVGDWNAWNLSPGEFIGADDSRDIRPANEQRFVNILAAALQKRGMPSFATHAILDTSRNAVNGLRWDWDEWCNVNGAGLGVRPSGQTGDEALDAFVWVKRPGESDGASAVGSENGEGKGCTAKSAVRPAPARDVWFQEFFEMLVRNARPAF